MGKEWNEKLKRTLTTSIVKASDLPRAGVLLITDLEDSEETLIEVLSADATKVIGQFLIRPTNRPENLRYREVRGWPEPKYE